MFSQGFVWEQCNTSYEFHTTCGGLRMQCCVLLTHCHINLLLNVHVVVHKVCGLYEAE